MPCRRWVLCVEMPEGQGATGTSSNVITIARATVPRTKRSIISGLTKGSEIFGQDHALIPAHPAELASLWTEGLICALDVSHFSLKVAAAVYSHAYSLQFIINTQSTSQRSHLIQRSPRAGVF